VRQIFSFKSEMIAACMVTEDESSVTNCAHHSQKNSAFSE
jgi:hypothetical protein